MATVRIHGTAVEVPAEDAGYLSDTPFNERYAGVEEFKMDFDNVIVVDNLPIAPEDKHAKLLTFVTKMFSAALKLAKENPIFMPLAPGADGAKSTAGFAFVECESKEAAEAARAKLDGFEFDTRHKLRALPYSTFAAAVEEPDDFTPPAPVALYSRDDAYAWLADDAGRDQFVLTWHNGRERQQEVLWSDGRHPPLLACRGPEDPSSSEFQIWRTHALRVSWSPKGTYLATLAKGGVRLWSGHGFAFGAGFRHTGVRAVVFSADERFMLTWNGRANNPTPADAIIVWDVRTGRELRRFKQLNQADDEPDMKWSPCGRFLARLETKTIKVPAAAGAASAAAGGATIEKQEQVIDVFEMPGCTLHNSRSVRASGAVEFAWSPGGTPMLSWWAPEVEPNPAGIAIMEFPSREVIRQRNPFNIDKCEFAWHPDGSHLAVILARAKRGKRGGGAAAALAAPGGAGAAGAIVGGHGYIIEIFRVKEKSVPVDTIEIDKEQGRVRGIHWEPTGNRFALVYGDRRTCNVAFYEVTADRGTQLLYTLEDKSAGSVSWSPRGEFAVLCGEGESAGHLEFIDVDRRKSLATSDHRSASGWGWDPSGRVFASWKTRPLDGDVLPRDMVDNGYNLYTFQGTRIFDTIKKEVWQFLWRPRPATLLSKEEQKAVMTKLKDYMLKYKDEEERDENRKKELERLNRRKERDDFRRLMAAKHAAYEAAAPRRAAMGIVDQAALDKASLIVETYEQILSETVETVDAAGAATGGAGTGARA